MGQVLPEWLYSAPLQHPFWFPLCKIASGFLESLSVRTRSTTNPPRTVSSTVLAVRPASRESGLSGGGTGKGLVSRLCRERKNHLGSGLCRAEAPISRAHGRARVNPTPYTLHPTPQTLHPTPQPPNPQPDGAKCVPKEVLGGPRALR